jgi:hypothetical protein
MSVPTKIRTAERAEEPPASAACVMDHVPNANALAWHAEDKREHVAQPHHDDREGRD